MNIVRMRNRRSIKNDGHFRKQFSENTIGGEKNKRKKENKKNSSEKNKNEIAIVNVYTVSMKVEQVFIGIAIS